MQEPTFTQHEIADYITGWLTSGQERYRFQDVIECLTNSFLQLNDEQDGLEAYAERSRAQNEKSDMSDAIVEFVIECLKADADAWAERIAKASKRHRR